MRAIEFHREYRSLWPAVANAGLLIDLYRGMGAVDPAFEAIKGSVPDNEIERALALLRKIDPPQANA